MPAVVSKPAPKTTAVCPIQLGAQYESFADLEAARRAYEKATCVPYTVDGSTLVKPQDGLPSKLKYSRVKYTCKHYGKGRNASQGIRPNQSSFKHGCGACFIVNADKKSGKLVVTKHVPNHQHIFESEETDLKKYPEYRRKNMDADLLKEAKNLINLNIKNIDLQRYLSEVKGKALTRQDINNMRAKMKDEEAADRTETEEFFDELESVLQNDPGSRVIFGVDDDEEEDNENECDDPTGQDEQKSDIGFVYFHSSEMARDFEAFPDVLVADSTYCTNKHDMPLMVFLCIDNYGNGRVAGYCIMKNEQQSTVKAAVKAFKEAHPQSSDKIRTVLVDKDYNERSVIHKIFPNCVIHICLFHTLQIFKRKTQAFPNRDEVRRVLEELAYAPTKEKYDEHYAELKKEASQEFCKYFNENWHNCLEVWASYQRDLYLNFGQTTTNVAESHNQKLKDVVKRSSKLVQLFKGLLKIHAYKSSAVAFRTFNGKVKIRYITTSEDPIVQDIINATTPFVGELLCTQYSWAMEKASIQNALPESFVPSTCSCRFFTGFQLPCSHIFLGRLQQGLEIFSADLIPMRWRLEYGRDLPSVDTESCATACENPVKVGGRPLSEKERFSKVMKLTSRLTELVKSCGGKQFSERLCVLKSVVKFWEKRQEVKVVPLNHESASAAAAAPVAYANTDIELQKEQEGENDQAVEAHELEEAIEEHQVVESATKQVKITSGTQYKVLNPIYRRTLVLPVGHVPKGRPKGKDRPTAIGRKRRRPDQEPSPASTGNDGETLMFTCNCKDNRNVSRRKMCMNNGPNHGKFYHSCPKKSTGRCKFFKWETSVPVCHCGIISTMKKFDDGQLYFCCSKQRCQKVVCCDSQGNVKETSKSHHLQLQPSDTGIPEVITLGDSSDDDSSPVYPAEIKSEADVVEDEDVFDNFSEYFGGFSLTSAKADENALLRSPEMCDYNIEEVKSPMRETEEARPANSGAIDVDVPSRNSFNCSKYPLSKQTNTSGKEYYGSFNQLTTATGGCSQFAPSAPDKKKSEKRRGQGNGECCVCGREGAVIACRTCNLQVHAHPCSEKKNDSRICHWCLCQGTSANSEGEVAEVEIHQDSEAIEESYSPPAAASSPAAPRSYDCYGCSEPLTMCTSTKPASKGKNFYRCTFQRTSKCKSFAFWAPGSGKATSASMPWDQYVTRRKKRPWQGECAMGDPLLSSTMRKESDEEEGKSLPKRERRLPFRLANSYHFDSIDE